MHLKRKTPVKRSRPVDAGRGRMRPEENLLRFRTAMDATADAIYLVDRASMEFIHINDAACRMQGRSREQVLALGPVGVLGTSRAELEQVYDAVIAGGAGTEPQEMLRQREDGSQAWIELRRRAQHSREGWMIVTVARDITARKDAEKQMLQLAHYDALTGLPNRALFLESLQRALAQAKERHWTVAVLFVELDRFKVVNDTLGHAAGDELLRQIGDRLVKSLRIRDTVARIGADDFGIILVTSANAAQESGSVADKCREALRARFDLSGGEVSITVSIGISIYPDDSADAAALVRNSETAMYRAKRAGRDAYRFYTAEMNARIAGKLETESALRKAIEGRQFVLHYQPKIRLASGRISGVEALLRWNRPGRGLVEPLEFVPVLEETGLIRQVGAWVIEIACDQIAEWNSNGLGPVRIAVNLSAAQFGSAESDLDAARNETREDAAPALLEFEVEAARCAFEHGVHPSLLEFELTESILMSNAQRAVTILRRLKARGSRLSMDDFGTGYSSLAYLRQFPIDTLKIDRAFVRDINSNDYDAAIAVAIIGLAHALKIRVVAEGVETMEQVEFLRANNCDEVQGYYYSRPLPALEMGKLLRANQRSPEWRRAGSVQNSAA